MNQDRRNVLAYIVGIAAIPELVLAGGKYKASDLSKDTEEVLLARMLFGEARGCTLEKELR